ncbi:hypothetical protein PMM47T1_13795 [Pseudomonas sp. M47T1]|uniref:hypothetical protein n=1 Tax=Pseudomonas sp. M47T1 TaxID=1179778 RepID=UPI00026085DA|nr:hypothetical protein [Pseudomonas sp. M47T1]EIK96037.1 hypothetical protein PMM47T1_13795 [Pseudomonas sp. M47T1]
MYVLVTRRRHLGVGLDQAAVRSAEAIKGDIEVRLDKAPCLGREANIAQMRPVDPMCASPLPLLYDATMTWMSTNGFVLSGVEEVDGVMYAQSWWCRET